MILKPLSAEYIFRFSNHSMRALTEHSKNEREINFYFDEKLVSCVHIPNGDLLSDDDHILEIIENHCNNSIDAYSDLFNKHSDKILLVSKEVSVIIENSGIEVMAHVKVYNNRYEISLSTWNGEDNFTGTFKSNNFSEALEKLRLFINTLIGVSDDLSINIDELSNDKIEQLIKWN